MKHLFLSALLAAGLMAADATGKWTGNLLVKNQDGEEQRPPAHLVLKQEGDKLTGTAGPNADQQWPIQNGKAEDDVLTFEVTNENAVMKFKLKLEGDDIKGDITQERDGNSRSGKLEVKRDK